MENDDIFAALDADDKTVVRPVVKPQPRTAPGQGSDAVSPSAPASQYLVRDTVDTINSIRQAGINPVIAAATPLLSLVPRIRSTLNLGDVSALHQRFSQEIQQFEQSAKQKNLDNQSILIARYVLCALLDETVLNTPWGANSSWGHRSLLSIFHKETAGGEKIFMVLERLLQDAAVNINLLELMSLCFLLGFKGKYRIDPMGDQKLENLQYNVLSRIQTLRGQPSPQLSAHWQGVNTTSAKKRVQLPIWIVAAVTGAVLVAIFAGFKFSLNSLATPVLSDLERIGKPAIEEEARR